MFVPKGAIWIFFVAYVVVFASSMGLAYQRDNAQKATVEVNGATVSVSCNPSPTTGGEEGK